MAGRIFRAAAIGDTGHFDKAGRYLGFAGGHGLHLPYQHLPQVEMVAVADADPKAREEGRIAAGAARAYADYREMLEKERPDIVSICSRHAERHEAVISAAAEAGVHIYVDKPMAPDLESADRMISACERRGVRLGVAHQSRYVEPFLTAKRMLDAGEIGTLLSMIGRGKEDHRGGGEDLMCCGVHTLDAMRFFAGDPLWVQGSCTVGGRPMARQAAYEGKDCNGPVGGDSVWGMFGFAGGVIGHAVSVRNQHLHGDRWGLTLIGTRGVLSLRYGDFERRTTLKISKAPCVPEEAVLEHVEAPFEPVVPGSEELGSVHMPTRGNRLAVWDILTSEQPRSSGHDGRWTIEMVHGIYASHLTGRRLTFPLADRRHPLAFGCEY
ncbi:Gfo/Idh/MocA family oxidoreductase [Chelativorans sp.]|uniref:Gfo/Idh/MocA family protein n=1 Tax=Chelativorans sp. TaxID=2203393 RepID=UPI002812453C|nr:Gfo/Idh/MocA family oxidoreductase [Chelativorans sp.]